MYIKQLICNEQEYWNFVWPIADWANNSNRSLWHEEDLSKLKLWFDFSNCGLPAVEEWTDEIKESFDFYQKCKEEYADKNRELRDSVMQFSAEEIFDGFGYEVSYDDEEYCYDKPFSLDKKFDATFPFVIIGDINCGFDRLGDIKVFSIYRVSLKDFEGKTDG